MISRYFKQSSENISYDFDFTSILGSDTISGSTVTADSGVTLGAKTTNANVVSQLVSGGTHSQNYKVTCVITTESGKTETMDLFIYVRDNGAGGNPLIGTAGSSL